MGSHWGFTGVRTSVAPSSRGCRFIKGTCIFCPIRIEKDERAHFRLSFLLVFRQDLLKTRIGANRVQVRIRSEVEELPVAMYEGLFQGCQGLVAVFGLQLLVRKRQGDRAAGLLNGGDA